MLSEALFLFEHGLLLLRVTCPQIVGFIPSNYQFHFSFLIYVIFLNYEYFLLSNGCIKSFQSCLFIFNVTLFKESHAQLIVG